MKSVSKFLVFGLLVTSLTGCIYIGDNVANESWRSEQRKNRELINNLELNTNQSSVQKTLGTPDFSEAFIINNETYKVLYYRTQRTHSDGDTTKDETTPLVFKEGQLIGWGHTVLESLER